MAMSYEEANATVHPVDKQWHYPFLTVHGYEPVTKEAVGFVRTYAYVNPVTKLSMNVTTGANADYWTDPDTGVSGYWGSLNSYLDSLPT